MRQKSQLPVAGCRLPAAPADDYPAPAGRKLAEWDAALRRELARRDERLLAVYEIYADRFGRDCTAAQIARALKEQHGPWAPSERSCQYWMHRVLSLQADFQP